MPLHLCPDRIKMLEVSVRYSNEADHYFHSHGWTSVDLATLSGHSSVRPQRSHSSVPAACLVRQRAQGRSRSAACGRPQGLALNDPSTLARCWCRDAIASCSKVFVLKENETGAVVSCARDRYRKAETPLAAARVPRSGTRARAGQRPDAPRSRIHSSCSRKNGKHTLV
jgi:hypothetical protein